MAAPEKVAQLVDVFARNIDVYKTPNYNETQVRREFIDPLFEALGWDVSNTAGYAQAYKDVIHEDAIKVSGIIRLRFSRNHFPIGCNLFAHRNKQNMLVECI
jgi:hypothetical protein